MLLWCLVWWGWWLGENPVEDDGKVGNVKDSSAVAATKVDVAAANIPAGWLDTIFPPEASSCSWSEAMLRPDELPVPPLRRVSLGLATDELAGDLPRCFMVLDESSFSHYSMKILLLLSMKSLTTNWGSIGSMELPLWCGNTIEPLIRFLFENMGNFLPNENCTLCLRKLAFAVFERDVRRGGPGLSSAFLRLQAIWLMKNIFDMSTSK